MPCLLEKKMFVTTFGKRIKKIKLSRMPPNKTFMFLINPLSGNAKIQKLIAKHIFECFEKRKGENGKK